MIIYSVPTGFVGSELQAYTSGTRIDRWDRTRPSAYKHAENRWNLGTIQNFNVATSDAVVSNRGPAFGQGIFAITSLPSSIVRRKALLKFPSSLTMCMHFVSGLKRAAA